MGTWNQPGTAMVVCWWGQVGSLPLCSSLLLCSSLCPRKMSREEGPTHHCCCPQLSLADCGTWLQQGRSDCGALSPWPQVSRDSGRWGKKEWRGQDMPTRGKERGKSKFLWEFKKKSTTAASAALTERRVRPHHHSPSGSSPG